MKLSRETKRKLRRIRKRVKNFILKALFFICATLCVCMMCGVEPATDGEMWLTIALFLGPLAYCGLFAYANGFI